MIFDCFMLNDELDMLECRFRELDHPGWHHILAEAPVTHRGDPKPLHYAQSQDRFAPWKNRITHVVADRLPAGDDPWRTEHAQRDAAMGALREMATAGDVVLISDVDEFPPQPLPAPYPAVAFRMRLAMYAADWLYPEPHVCSVAATWDYVRDRGLAVVRDSRHAFPAADGGWHLTWLGGEDAQRAKLRVHCHTEMRPDEQERIASGRAYRLGEHQSGTCMMIPADVDGTWPAWIRDRKCPPEWFRPRSE